MTTKCLWRTWHIRDTQKTSYCSFQQHHQLDLQAGKMQSQDQFLCLPTWLSSSLFHQHLNLNKYYTGFLLLSASSTLFLLSVLCKLPRFMWYSPVMQIPQTWSSFPRWRNAMPDQSKLFNKRCKTTDYSYMEKKKRMRPLPHTMYKNLLLKIKVIRKETLWNFGKTTLENISPHHYHPSPTQATLPRRIFFWPKVGKDFFKRYKKAQIIKVYNDIFSLVKNNNHCSPKTLENGKDKEKTSYKPEGI